MNIVVIPAYNEEKKIGRTLSGLLKLDCIDKIVVVDDSSIDNTIGEAKKYGVMVLKHSVNRGQGAALQTGHEYAVFSRADVVIDFDADDQNNAQDICRALEVLQKEKLDILFGSRFLDNRSQIPWSKKHIILPVSRVINYIFTGVKLTDAHNGFRVMGKKALEKICISQDRMAHNTEILQQTKKFGLSFKEIPVEVKYHRFGQGIKGGMEIIKDLLIKR